MKVRWRNGPKKRFRETRKNAGQEVKHFWMTCTCCSSARSDRNMKEPCIHPALSNASQDELKRFTVDMRENGRVMMIFPMLDWDDWVSCGLFVVSRMVCDSWTKHTSSFQAHMAFNQILQEHL